MGDVIIASITGRPDMFSYQGQYFRKISESYDAPSFTASIEETLNIIGDEITVAVITLSSDDIPRLNNTTGDDLPAVYVQMPGHGVKTNIAVVDAFTDCSAITIDTKEQDGSSILMVNDLQFTTPGTTQQLRLKGVLYNITFHGVHEGSTAVGSVAFNLDPSTEALIKTKDLNLITTINGTGYIDLISSTIS
jgi:hypothetical protein